MISVICKSAYLYFYNGCEMTCYSGMVVKDSTVNFITKESDVFSCSPKSGTLEYSVVWFEEKDDEAARNLYIKEEQEQVYLLEQELEYHKTKIEMLKGLVVTNESN